MRVSESINELAAALTKAQGEMKAATKDVANAFYKTRYADLASVWEACRLPLANNGLSVLQSPRLISSGEQWLVELETILMHASGQFLADVLTVPLSKLDAQSVGSATTYARRYSLAAFVGVAPEDDDAESAVGRGNGHSTATRPQPPRKAPPDHLPTNERKHTEEDQLQHAAEKAKAGRTPDQLYSSASSVIKVAKHTTQLESIRGAVQQYGAEGTFDADQVRTLEALIEKRWDELGVPA